MGYTTDFSGCFELDKPLEDNHKKYLESFAYIRHMKRSPMIAEKFKDPTREAVGLPIGPEGAYFVGSEDPNNVGGDDSAFGGGHAGQTRDASIIDYNREPEGVPSLWCQWIPTEDGKHIEWDGGEKFYNYVEWIEYIIEHFLAPWGYTLNGEVEWYGEDVEDRGKIVIEDNEVRTLLGRIVYEEV